MRRHRQLWSRIFASVLAILVASALVGFVLTALHERRQFVEEYQRRALAIAQTFAADPALRAALAHPTPAGHALVRQLAASVTHETGATYIVVIDRAGVRWSHPRPSLIGKKVNERVIALDGRDHVGTDHGNLGVSANARVPIWRPSAVVGGGARGVVGEVSAGILERQVSDQLLSDLPVLVLYFLYALGIGVIASVLLARRLKRTTFGLELEEIAGLLQEREAMLHGIREGVIVVDPRGRITLVNDEARRLVPLGEDPVGSRLEALLPEGRLRDVLTGAVAGRDEVVLTDDHVLAVNRMEVSRGSRALGAVVTLRDRTELEGLLRELDNVDALTNALRAQQHEFSNQLHTLAGLIEIGEPDAAAAFALDALRSGEALAESIRERVERSELVALLVAKTTIAAERGVELIVDPASDLPDTGELTSPLLTIVGNLINNALDAAAESGPDGRVSVLLRALGGRVEVSVMDSGPGVPPELEEAIFTDGFTTKGELGHRNQGLGLALVHRLVVRAGGTISVSSEPTTFCVSLPLVGAVSEAGR
jgi:two-component system CitB family sensor kinase